MSALLVLYGLTVLAGHVDQLPDSAPTHAAVQEHEVSVAGPSSHARTLPAEPDEVPEPWASLADCESGDWIDGGISFVAGSARWDWGAPGMDLPPWGTDLHDGGLQFAPSTWQWVAGDVLEEPPDHAYEATPREQVAVAVEVQARQGWKAWPICSKLTGLR